MARVACRSMTTPYRSCAPSGDDEIPDRIAVVKRLRTAVVAVDRIDHGLLRFPARDDVEADVRRFAVDETRCCQFWGFAVDTRR